MVLEISYKNRISINYVPTEEKQKLNEIIVNSIFTFNIVLNIVNDNEDLDNKSVKKYQYKYD